MSMVCTVLICSISLPTVCSERSRKGRVVDEDVGGGAVGNEVTVSVGRSGFEKRSWRLGLGWAVSKPGSLARGQMGSRIAGEGHTIRDTLASSSR